MRPLGVLLLAGVLLAGRPAWGQELENPPGSRRVQSRYCTLWIDPETDIKKVSNKISIRGISRLKLPKGSSPETELAAKCDILFERAEEILDMYPPGIHVTLKVVASRDTISQVHKAQYDVGTDAPAIYLFESNTIYAWAKEISESVLIHEMAHCILDHYFQVRPPRKIEELLAMHVDAQMRE